MDNNEEDDDYSKTIYSDAIDVMAKDGSITPEELAMAKALARKEQRRRKSSFWYKVKQEWKSILVEAWKSVRGIITAVITAATIAATAYFTGAFNPTVDKDKVEINEQSRK